jgi:hypothetical protein
LPAPFALPLAYGIRHRAGCLRYYSRLFCQRLALGAPLLPRGEALEHSPLVGANID